MKYALFEFVVETWVVEIGETRWILPEDPKKIENDSFDWQKEVMVAWPNDFAKIHKRIVKNSIDSKSLPTTTCVAKVIQFSGKFICFHNNEFN